MSYLSYTVADIASALMYPTGAMAVGLIFGLLWRLTDRLQSTWGPTGGNRDATATRR
jgi:hypothetical protein